MDKINFATKEIEITKGSLIGKKGSYLGTDGYSESGVICKLLIDSKPVSYRWDYFKFTDLTLQEAWEADDSLETLDF